MLSIQQLIYRKKESINEESVLQLLAIFKKKHIIRSRFVVRVVKTSFDCDRGDIAWYNHEIWCESCT